ncbi:MAG: hypothetical protein HW421_1668 [Ignavibacteria bacterium]|nr:hypothetical protein [Ignavibacteria bacterium]
MVFFVKEISQTDDEKNFPKVPNFRKVKRKAVFRGNQKKIKKILKKNNFYLEIKFFLIILKIVPVCVLEKD